MQVFTLEYKQRQREVLEKLLHMIKWGVCIEKMHLNSSTSVSQQRKVFVYCRQNLPVLVNSEAIRNLYNYTTNNDQNIS